MKERIQELAEEAGILEEGYPVSDRVAGELEKFAELIVRECGQHLNSPEFIGRRDLDWAMVLNEYFGVE